MNRTEQKCLMGSALFHGLLVGGLALASLGFASRQTDLKTFEIIDWDKVKITDDESKGGEPGVVQPTTIAPAVTPPAAPPAEPMKAVVVPPPPVRSTPPPEPVRPPPKQDDPVPAQPPKPRDDIKADIAAEKVPKKDEKKPSLLNSPVDRSANKKPVTPPKETPKRTVDLSKVTTRDMEAARKAREQAERATAERQAQEAANKRRQDLLKGVRSAIASVQTSTSGRTSIEATSGPGGGGEAAINYAEYVVNEFERNWVLPSSIRDDSVVVKVRVTITSDGRVLDSSILSRSGDSSVDRSVDDVLRRVKQVRGFPSGSSKEPRTYTINFKPRFKEGAG